MALMKMRSLVLLGAYLCVGVVAYTIIKVVAGGVGLFGLGGVSGEALEFLLVVLAWPLVLLVSVLVVMQGR